MTATSSHGRRDEGEQGSRGTQAVKRFPLLRYYLVASLIIIAVLTTSELSLHRCPAVKARRMATPSNSGHSAHGS